MLSYNACEGRLYVKSAYVPVGPLPLTRPAPRPLWLILAPFRKQPHPIKSTGVRDRGYTEFPRIKFTGSSVSEKSASRTFCT